MPLKKRIVKKAKTARRKTTVAKKLFTKRRLTMIAIGAVVFTAFGFNFTYHRLKDTFAASVTLSVKPTVETVPVTHSGDAADDIAIWVNPVEASLSAVIGTDKKGGISVYDMKGGLIEYRPDGQINNVDLREGFLLNGQSTILVTATDRSARSLVIYSFSPVTRTLTNITNRLIKPTNTPYGICMYHSAITGKFYSFITGEKGTVEQWELFDAGNGKVDAVKATSFVVSSGETEGCVADDQLAKFYVSDEDNALWKYGAEPNDATPRVAVDVTTAGGHVTADIEGLSLSYNADGTGYLFASSQGNNTYAVYRREGNNAFVKNFNIVNSTVNGVTVDGTSNTDGIDVTNANLGSAFPYGVFIAQDNTNDVGYQNFKYVPLQSILGLPGGTPTPVVSPTSGPVPTATPFISPTSVVSSPTPIVPTVTPTPAPTAIPATPAITPTPGGSATTNILPIADSYVQADTPTTNKGTSTSLNVNGGSNPARITYFKFDLRSLSSSPVVSAKLHLKVTNESASIQSIKDVSDNSWVESTINYNNRPLPGAVVTTNNGGARGFIDINLTSYVSTKMGQIFTIAIDQTGSDGTTYNSKESSTDKPVLIVTQ